MTGQASGGQTLTPNPNVNAPINKGGSIYGANGGGGTAIGNGVTGQTGWDERVAPAQGRAQTAANYQAPKNAVLAQQANAALAGSSFDDALAAGGSNQG